LSGIFASVIAEHLRRESLAHLEAVSQKRFAEDDYVTAKHHALKIAAKFTILDICKNIITLITVAKATKYTGKAKEMKDTTLSELDETITYNVYRSGRLLRHFLQQKLKIDEEHLTPEQFFILLRLYVKDGQTQRELADKILNDHPNITRLIDKLEQKAYVQRANNATDRRSYLITLSAKGREFCASRVPLIHQERERILKGLTKKELDMFKGILRRIEANIMA